MKDGEVIKRARERKAPAGDIVPLTATMPRSDSDRMKKAAKKAGVSVGAFVGEHALASFNDREA